MKLVNLENFLRERLLLNPFIAALWFAGLKAVYCVLIYAAITTPENMSRSESWGWNFAWALCDITFDLVFIAFCLHIILLKQAKIHTNMTAVSFCVLALFAAFFIYLFVNDYADKKDLSALFCLALQAFLWIYFIASTVYLKKKFNLTYPITLAILFCISYFASFVVSLKIGSIFFTILFPVAWIFYFKYKFANLLV